MNRAKNGALPVKTTLHKRDITSNTPFKNNPQRTMSRRFEVFRILKPLDDKIVIVSERSKYLALSETNFTTEKLTKA